MKSETMPNCPSTVTFGQQTEFFLAKCPSCSGELQLPSHHEKVRCMYCGREIVIQSALQSKYANVGIDVANLWKLAEVAEKSGNFSEAFHYFTRILEVTPEDSRAWVGKGIAAGAQSTLGCSRLNEMYCAFDNAIQLANADERQQLSARIEAISPTIAVALYNTSYNHLTEFVDVPGMWTEHLERSLDIGMNLLNIEALTGEMPGLLETAIAILRKDLSGFQTTKCDYGALLPRVENRKPSREHHIALTTLLNEAIARLRRIRPDVKISPTNHYDSGSTEITVLGVLGIILTFWVAKYSGEFAGFVVVGGTVGVLLSCAFAWANNNKA